MSIQQPAPAPSTILPLVLAHLRVQSRDVAGRHASLACNVGERSVGDLVIGDSQEGSEQLRDVLLRLGRSALQSHVNYLLSTVFEHMPAHCKLASRRKFKYSRGASGNIRARGTRASE